MNVVFLFANPLLLFEEHLSATSRDLGASTVNCQARLLRTVGLCRRLGRDVHKEGLQNTYPASQTSACGETRWRTYCWHSSWL